MPVSETDLMQQNNKKLTDGIGDMVSKVISLLADRNAGSEKIIDTLYDIIVIAVATLKLQVANYCQHTKKWCDG